MNFRERFINTLLFKPVDRLPCMDFGYWPETIECWHSEGLPKDIRSISQVEDHIGLDRGYLGWHKSFDTTVEYNDVLYVQANYLDYWGDIYPPYKVEILAEDEFTITARTPAGSIQRQNKGMQSMPQFIKFPVSNFEEWDEVKTHLDGKAPERYPVDWDFQVKAYKKSDKPLGLYIFGFFGMARDMMGLENLSMAYYDQPDLVTAMAEHHTQFTMEAYDRVTKDLPIDFVITFEDMCYNSGALISPKIFRKFMSPYYSQITKFFKSRGVKSCIVDTDGNVMNIMELFLESGVDGCLPCEVHAGSHPVLLREKYPGIQLMGGFDKMAVISGKEAIDREFEKLIPLMESGGYIPTFDHLVPPTVKYDHYLYFCERRRVLAEKHHQ